MGVAADDPHPVVAQRGPHPVFIAGRHEDCELAPGVPAHGGQDLQVQEPQSAGQMVVQPLGGQVQVGMARDRGHPGPDHFGQQGAHRAVFPNVGGRLIQEGMVGEKKLRLLVPSLRHHRRAYLQGHEDGGHRSIRVPHLEADPVFGQGPGKRVSRVQTGQNILYRRRHQT